jgi:hypothetical protein
MANVILSNKVISVVAALLLAGILLDGKLYNRLPQSTGIYSISAYPDVTVSKDNQTIMKFKHMDGRWHLTEPFVAPVHASRVQPLLDTNTQTLRSYELSELDNGQLFNNSVQLEIDNQLYQIGQLEPVSKMRYTLANNRVYLQADHVLPLLRAGQKAFVDLTVSGTVTSVQINDNNLPDVSAWSNLDALGLITPEQVSGQPLAVITVNAKKSRIRSFQLYAVDGIAALLNESGKYGYLFSARQAETLGLTDFL